MSARPTMYNTIKRLLPKFGLTPTSYSPRPLSKIGREDLEITERLYKSGKIIGIGLIDHVIIGESWQYYSFKERGNIR